MEEFSSLLEGQTNMESTMLATQEVVSRDWTQELVIPQHLMTPQIGSSSQGSVNNLTNYSTQQCDVQSVLEEILDERHIEESLIRSKLLSYQLGPCATYMSSMVRCYWRELDEMQSTSKSDYIHAVRRRGKGFTDSDSPFRGVYRNRVPDSRKWEARLGREGLPTINLGTYYTAEDAARAYDIVSIKLKGWDAITNFDWNGYEVEGIMESVIAQAMDGSVILQKEGTNNETEAYPQSNSRVQRNPQQLRNSLVQHNPQQPSNSIGQHNPQQLSNSSFSHGCQNPSLVPRNPYNTLGGVTGGARNSGNSIGNQTKHGGAFSNQTATLQQSLQTHSQVNVNNNFNNQNLLNNNNQFLSQSSNLPLLAHGTQNLELKKCLRFPDWPSGFGTKLLGVGGNMELEPLSNIPALNEQSLTHGMVSQSAGATNGVCSFGSEIQPVAPSNQECGATQLQLPELNQSYEPYNNNANTLNQKQHQNLNSCSSGGFQIPSSEANNNGSQSQTSGSQIDLDMRNYLNRSYIEDDDFACDFDLFSAMNGGRQSL
ncbi:AP2 ethylene-responsive transcription factor PLT1 [Spatholobus suberectus]|nr:AP2 ethylene-responsive transcription factor PLT1 [Spatholobus suberectus]